MRPPLVDGENVEAAIKKIPERRLINPTSQCTNLFTKDPIISTLLLFFNFSQFQSPVCQIKSHFPTQDLV